MRESSSATELCVQVHVCVCVCFAFASAEESVDRYKRFLVLTAAYSIAVPKFHLYLHILQRADHFGNPRCYATWYDEHVNKILKAVLSGVSQQTFEASAFMKIADAVQRGPKRARE